MERLVRREVQRRIFEDGVRWVDAIQNSEVDARQFVCWVTLSPAHMEAFFEAWTIWHDLRALSPEQRGGIERVAPDLH